MELLFRPRPSWLILLISDRFMQVSTSLEFVVSIFCVGSLRIIDMKRIRKFG